MTSGAQGQLASPPTDRGPQVCKVKSLSSPPSPGPRPGSWQRAPALGHQRHLPFTKSAAAPSGRTAFPADPARPPTPSAFPAPQPRGPAAPRPGRFQLEREPKQRSVSRGGPRPARGASPAPRPPPSPAPRLPAPGCGWLLLPAPTRRSPPGWGAPPAR